VVDGVKGPEFAADTWWGPIFSTDSRHYAYTTGTRHEKTPRHCSAFIDGQPLALPWHGTNVLDVFFSPDLKRWACTIERNGKQQVYVDGQFGPVYDGVYDARFSSDGSRYAYRARQGKSWRMVVDGKPETEISLNSATPCFSSNGKRLAYVAGRGPEWWIMLDRKAGSKFKGPGERSVLSSEETEVSGLVQQPQFSPDSRHLAYAAFQDDRWGVLINHRPVGNLYDSIIRGGPSFHEDGLLEFLGIHKGVLYRITCKARPS
jgi:hypothetical protein